MNPYCVAGHGLNILQGLLLQVLTAGLQPGAEEKTRQEDEHEHGSTRRGQTRKEQLPPGQRTLCSGSCTSYRDALKMTPKTRLCAGDSPS